MNDVLNIQMTLARKMIPHPSFCGLESVSI